MYCLKIETGTSNPKWKIISCVHGHSQGNYYNVLMEVGKIFWKQTQSKTMWIAVKMQGSQSILLNDALKEKIPVILTEWQCF